MSVKNKNPKKAKVSKKDKKEIKKAVEKLPGLIVERVRLSEPAPQMEIPAIEPSQEPTSQKPNSSGRARVYHNPRQTRWLWIGVISFCLMIFGLWGWNTYVLITDTTKDAESKSWLPNPVSDDLRTVWEEVGAADNSGDNKETIKEKIKTNLRGLVTQIKSASTVTSTSTVSSTEPAEASL